MKLFKDLGTLTETKAFKIGGTIALVLLIPLTVFIARQQQDIRQRAQTVPSTPPIPQASFGFGPSVQTVALTTASFPVSVTLNTNAVAISGIDVTISYNKDVLTVSSFTPTTLWNSVLYNTIDPIAGTIRFTAVDTINSAPSNYIPLGTITFVPKALGMTTVVVQNAQLTSANLPGNVPYNASIGGTYTVAAPTPTPTNTPVPTNTPTPTVMLPTNVPTLPPTATPIPPTATPTPTNTPTPIVYAKGDINKDGAVNILDFNIWRDEFKQFVTTKTADINNDGKIDLLDFNTWRTGFVSQFPPN